MLKIYLCAFINPVYLKEAEVSIQSIRTIGNFTGDIYLFTDMEKEANKYSTLTDVKIIRVNCPSINFSACYRAMIFNHVPMSTDDVFLYLDTDIVVVKPIEEPLINKVEDKILVYGYPKRTQVEHSFAGFLTNDTAITSQMAFCSGILLFRASDKIKKCLEDIVKLYSDLIKKKKINDCWEQPALCLKLIEQDLVSVALNDYVYEERAKPSTGYDTFIFNHFCGMRSGSRSTHMREVWKTALAKQSTP
jgi:hypothetical protein